MARPVTLFMGQWADLALEDLAKKASNWGFDGLELACWGDHFEVDKALQDPDYCQGKHDLLTKYGLKCGQSAITLSVRRSATISTAGIKRFSLPNIWGDGDAEGVRQRAADEMKRPHAPRRSWE